MSTYEPMNAVPTSLRWAGLVLRPMTLQSTVDDVVQVPPGACEVQQGVNNAVLYWADGERERHGAMSVELLLERLADGSLRRQGSVEIVDEELPRARN